MGNGILSIEECLSNILFRRIHDSRLDPVLSKDAPYYQGASLATHVSFNSER